MKRDSIKWIEIAVIVLFVFSLIPLLLISFYSHPLFDDYAYSHGVHKEALREGSNILTVLKVSLTQAYETYKGWQGCFFATFLETLQPGAWPVPIYWLTAFFLIGSLVFSHIVFCKSVVCNLYGGKKENAIIIALLILEFQIQFVPFIKESFYWYNGGVCYIFFFSLMVTQWALIVNELSVEKKKNGRIILISFLTFLIGGGNYSTALINPVLLVTVLLMFALYKKRRVASLILWSVTSIVSLGISIVAPGNAVRARSYASPSAITAILSSLKYAMKCVVWWTKLPQLGLIILLALLFYPIIKNTKRKFRFPILFVLYSFGIFAAQSTPPLFAMQSVGGLRQINMYYFSYYLMLASIVFYIEGWVLGKIKDRDKIERMVLRVEKPAVVISVMIIGIGTLMYGLRHTAFCTTLLDLKSGRAQRYDAEYKRIVELIESSDGPVYTTDINEWPDTFYRLDLRQVDDIGFWINASMAKYFGVPAIYLDE